MSCLTWGCILRSRGRVDVSFCKNKWTQSAGIKKIRQLVGLKPVGQCNSLTIPNETYRGKNDLLNLLKLVKIFGDKLGLCIHSVAILYT